MVLERGIEEQTCCSHCKLCKLSRNNHFLYKALKKVFSDSIATLSHFVHSNQAWQWVYICTTNEDSQSLSDLKRFVVAKVAVAHSSRPSLLSFQRFFDKTPVAQRDTQGVLYHHRLITHVDSSGKGIGHKIVPKWWSIVEKSYSSVVYHVHYPLCLKAPWSQ